MTHVFYDGGCGLCHAAVRFVARRDRSEALRFAPLQGKSFMRLVSFERQVCLPDSLVVLTPESDLLTQSEAVIHLLCRMGPAWRAGGAILGWIPVSMRDAAYRLVVRLRGSRQACSADEQPVDSRFDP